MHRQQNDCAQWFSGGADDRMMVGLSSSSPADTLSLAYLSTNDGDHDVVFSGSVGGTVSFTHVNNHWYQVSFDLIYDGPDTWTVRDLAVRDWGADGVTGGSSFGPLASESFNPSFKLGQRAPHGPLLEPFNLWPLEVYAPSRKQTLKASRIPAWGENPRAVGHEEPHAESVLHSESVISRVRHTFSVQGGTPRFPGVLTPGWYARGLQPPWPRSSRASITSK